MLLGQIGVYSGECASRGVKIKEYRLDTRQGTPTRFPERQKYPTNFTSRAINESRYACSHPTELSLKISSPEQIIKIKQSILIEHIGGNPRGRCFHNPAYGGEAVGVDRYLFDSIHIAEISCNAL